jgi:hypothetical protein
MSRSIRQRLHACFLLALFAGSGLGLPALDELLYHSDRDAGPPAGTPHLDPPNGCGAHSERCVLPNVLSVRPFVSAAHAITRLEPPTRDIVVFRFISSLRSIDRSLLQPSRAPPVFAS